MKGSSDSTTADIRYELIPEAHTEHTAGDPIALARRHLRGRWLPACLLAILLAGVLATAAYLLTPVTWESTGRIRVSSNQPIVLYGSGRIESQVGMKNFAHAQALLLSSREVAQTAAFSPAMRTVGWPQDDAGVQKLQDLITVSVQGSDQFLDVVAQHRDARTARIAVDAVLDAYMMLYMQREHINPADIESRLVDRQLQLETTLAELRQQLLDATDQYGIEALEQMHVYKVEELIAIDQKIAELALAVASAEAQLRGEPAFATFAASPTSNTKSTDSQTDALLERERTLIAEIQSWRDRYGPAHPMIRELSRQLEALRIRLNLRQTALNIASTTPAGSTSSPAGALNSVSTAGARAMLEHLLQMEQTYRAMRQTLHREAAALGNKFAIAGGLVEHIDEVRQQLGDTRKRIDALRIEHHHDQNEAGAALVSIASRAGVPAIPVKDRRVGMAAASAMVGIFAGFGLMMLSGMFDPRCRFASELQQLAEQTPMLAIIPDISGNSKQRTQQSAIAVHQLRNALQINTRDRDARVFAISSTGEGEGKTSLTLALGTSFAAAGARTLMIDGDVADPQLSRETGMEKMPGLYQALGIEDGQGGEVHRTSTEHLWVLPVGRSGGFDSRMISCSRLQLILQTLRHQFDAIVIDSGAITTSLSGEVCCAAADATVLVAARNQQRPLIAQSIRRLEDAHVPLAGLVMNRAAACDVRGHDMPAASEREAAVLVPEARAQRIESLKVDKSSSPEQISDVPARSKERKQAA